MLTADLISLIQVPAGVAIPGAPDCLQYVDLGLSATTLVFGSPTATLSFLVPNNPGLFGMPLAVQSASLVPGINPLGVITSNGLLSTIRREEPLGRGHGRGEGSQPGPRRQCWHPASARPLSPPATG